MPSKAQARTLDALFTACVDHGVTPAAMIGRAFASYGTNVPQAIAAGILLFGDIAGGAGDPMARIMAEALGEAVESQQVIDDATVTQAAKKIEADTLLRSGRMPGFGIPAHATDPRAPALLKVAQDSGAAGPYCRLLVAIERELAIAKQRPIPINLDGIVASTRCRINAFPARPRCRPCYSTRQPFGPSSPKFRIVVRGLNDEEETTFSAES